MKADRDRSIDELLRRGGAGSGTPAGPCPDAETLAALVDAGLDRAERRALESHLADCVRCQALTAAMARAADADRPRDAHADAPWWVRRHLVAWLAPAAAASLAIALWAVVPGQRTPPAQEQVAQVAVPAAEPPPAPPADPPPARTEGVASRDRQTLGDTALQAPAPAAAPPASPASPAAETLNRANRPAESRADGAPADAMRGAPTAPPRAEERVSSLAARAMAEAAPERDGAPFAAPGSEVRWRIRGALVERSTDGGATWTTSPASSPAPLTAGSAPAPDVCWLVGREGVVLRTTDGGTTWTRLPFPERTDLARIDASSALAATIDLADGRQFTTADGGRTWTAVDRR